MFCLGCGAELNARAEVCAVCGRPAHPESPLSPRTPQRATATTPRVTRGPTPAQEHGVIPAPPAQPRPAASGLVSGDLALFALPHDVTGRLVVVLPFLLAADLLAPWIVLGDAHVAPARAGLLALVVALPFALIAAMTVYLPFRQRPILAAIPLIIATLALGGGLVLLLTVGLLGARIVSVIGDGTLERLNVFLVTGAQTPVPTPLTLAPDIGLFAFIIGAGALVVASYRRLEELIASQYIVSTPIEAAAIPAAPEPDGEKAQAGAATEAASGNAPGAPPAKNRSERPTAALPGTPAWTETPALPAIVRNGPPIRGLRRFDPRG